MRLIDADALKEKLPNTYRNGFENCRECRLLEREEVNAYIDRMPTIDAAHVKHGKWIDKGSLSCRCSKCGCKNGHESKFCPNCGAKMDLEG